MIRYAAARPLPAMQRSLRPICPKSRAPERIRAGESKTKEGISVDPISKKSKVNSHIRLVHYPKSNPTRQSCALSVIHPSRPNLTYTYLPPSHTPHATLRSVSTPINTIDLPHRTPQPPLRNPIHEPHIIKLLQPPILLQIRPRMHRHALHQILNQFIRNQRVS